MLKRVTLAALLAFGHLTSTMGRTAQTFVSPAGVETLALGGSQKVEAERALVRLGNLSMTTVRQRLAKMRKPAYMPGPLLLKKIVERQHLPVATGERADRLKAALRPVLAYHERDGKLPVIILRSGHPRAYLAERAALIITTKTMLILSEAEMRGIVAHELAHEYLWDERKQAVREKDQGLMREIEYFCDAAAVVTLKEIGDDTAHYAQALERMTYTGMITGGATRMESQTHPSLDARVRLIKLLGRRLDSSSIMVVEEQGADMIIFYRAPRGTGSERMDGHLDRLRGSLPLMLRDAKVAPHQARSIARACAAVYEKSSIRGLSP